MKPLGRTSWLNGMTAVFCAISVLAMGVRNAFQIYSLFLTTDDEGYLYATIKPYLQGHPLYREVYTQYGPFYYLYKRCLHGLTGWPVSHDIGRLFALGAWMLSSLLIGFAIWRVTRSLWFSCLIYCLCSWQLTYIEREPAHPQELIALLVAACLLLMTYAVSRRGGYLYCLGTGLAVGALLMTKINLGIFVLIGFCLSYLLFLPSSTVKWVAYRSLAAATCLLPLVLMRSDLHAAWAVRYAAIVALSVFSIVLISPKAIRSPAFTGRHSALFCAGLLFCLGATIALTLASGASSHEMLTGVLLQHLRFSKAYQFPATIPAAALLWCLLLTSLALWVYMRFLRHDKPLPPEVQYSLLALRLALTCALFLGSRLWFVLPGLWLSALPMAAPGASMTAQRRFFDTALCLLTVLLSLQAYPVAGSQLQAASVLLFPSLLLGLRDLGLPLLRERAGTRTLLAYAPLGAGLFLCVLTLPFAAYRGRAYFRLTRLDLPGARWVRLDEYHVAVLRSVTANVAANFDTFASLPGLNSFYFWAQETPPTFSNLGDWVPLFDVPRQQAIVSACLQHPRIGFIRSRTIADFWRAHSDLASSHRLPSPILDWVDRDLIPRVEIGGYELLTPRDRKLTTLRECAVFSPLPADASPSVPGETRNALHLYAPEAIEGRTHRYELVNPQTHRTLALLPAESSAKSPQRPGSSGAPSNGRDHAAHVTRNPPGETLLIFPTDPAMSAAARQNEPDNSLLVRLLDGQGKRLLTVPVITLK